MKHTVLPSKSDCYIVHLNFAIPLMFHGGYLANLLLNKFGILNTSTLQNGQMSNGGPWLRNLQICLQHRNVSGLWENHRTIAQVYEPKLGHRMWSLSIFVISSAQTITPTRTQLEINVTTATRTRI